MAPRSLADGLSLRQRITLTLGVVMVAVLAITVALAYGEVRYATRLAAGERLASVAEQLADLVEAGSRTREGLVDSITSLPVARRALAGQALDADDRARLSEALADLRGPADSGLVVQLVRGGGEVVGSVGFVRGTRPDPTVDPGLEARPTWGRLRPGDGESLYWTAYPSAARGPAGWVLQERRMGNAQSATSVQRLVGSDVVLSFFHRDDSVWVSLAGEGEIAPADDLPASGETFEFVRRGTRHLAAVAVIQGTPWSVVVEAPMSTVAARPRTFLSHMAWVAIGVILAALLLGWLLGHRLGEPIQELAIAADAVAEERYDHRVREDRAGELGRLARAFNAMSHRVAASHEELRQRAADLERANVEAEAARREAQAASRAKSDFLATMSHEVRTPINAVLGYTELLQLEVPGPLNEKQEEYLVRIQRASRLLISLVEDVLDFARIESGELPVDAGVGLMEEAIEAAVAVIEPQATAKGVVVSVAPCPPESAFLGDTRRVQQVLLNLVANAVKFTPEGGRVELRCERVEGGPETSDWGGDWLRVDVEDTGIGIRPEQLEHVFEPFVQGTSGYTRDYGGAGLGLSISRRLAGLMGGAVTAESEAGRGSCFSLWLRAADAADADTRAA